MRGRKRVRRSRDVDQERAGNSQCDRESQGEDGPLPVQRLEFQGAAEGAHTRDDDVNADPAPRDRGDRSRRGKSGVRQHLQQRIIIECFYRRREKALFVRASQDDRSIDASAVVFDLQDHCRAIACGAQHQSTRRGFADRPPRFCILDAVVERVPEQVHNGITDRVQQRAIELDVPPFGHELHLLAEVARNVTHQAREPIKHLPHRHHARLQDLILQGTDQSGRFVRRAGERAGGRVIAFLGDTQQAVSRDDQFADQIEQRIESSAIHPHRAQCVARAVTARLGEEGVHGDVGDVAGRAHGFLEPICRRRRAEGNREHAIKSIVRPARL